MEIIKELIRTESSRVKKEIIDIRAHLHKNPELSFEEFDTSIFIQKHLNEIGIPFKSGFIKTGIVATLESGDPSSANFKTIALRADMDALPIHEHTDNKYCSTKEGIMHACGHDMHMASLIGTAKVLHKLKDYWQGRILLIFQPGEELLPGGAKQMISEGALDPKPEWILAQHVLADMPTGHVGFRSGMYMASGDEIYLTIKGKGGHAAMPQNCTDTVLIASHIIVALQQIVSRNGDTRIPTVLSFGKFIAQGATNIIPDKVEIEGTFRTMNEAWRSEAKKLIKRIAEGTAEAMGASCDVVIKHGYPFLVNDKTRTNTAKQNAIDILGHENVEDMDIRMTTEDFAYYSQKYPCTFYRFGVAPNNDITNGSLHTSTFQANEQALETAINCMAYLTICTLSK